MRSETFQKHLSNSLSVYAAVDVWNDKFPYFDFYEYQHCLRKGSLSMSHASLKYYITTKGRKPYWCHNHQLSIMWLQRKGTSQMLQASFKCYVTTVRRNSTATSITYILRDHREKGALLKSEALPKNYIKQEEGTLLLSLASILHYVTPERGTLLMTEASLKHFMNAERRNLIDVTSIT